MSATASLRRDHDIIEKVLKALEATIALFREGHEIPMDVLNDTLDFVVNFIDRCHHGKEEEGLFPSLNERGLPRDQGPIAVMLREHEEGRRLTNMLKDAIDRYANDKSAKDLIVRIAEQYIALLTQHIWKENNILFNLADSILYEDADKIATKLDGIEEEKIGKDREEYTKLAERLVSLVRR